MPRAIMAYQVGVMSGFLGIKLLLILLLSLDRMPVHPSSPRYPLYYWVERSNYDKEPCPMTQVSRLTRPTFCKLQNLSPLPQTTRPHHPS